MYLKCKLPLRKKNVLVYVTKLLPTNTSRSTVELPRPLYVLSDPAATRRYYKPAFIFKLFYKKKQRIIRTICYFRRLKLNWVKSKENSTNIDKTSKNGTRSGKSTLDEGTNKN
jgi:hypothetical protein